MDSVQSRSALLSCNSWDLLRAAGPAVDAKIRRDRRVRRARKSLFIILPLLLLAGAGYPALRAATARPVAAIRPQAVVAPLRVELAAAPAYSGVQAMPQGDWSALISYKTEDEPAASAPSLADPAADAKRLMTLGKAMLSIGQSDDAKAMFQAALQRLNDSGH